LAAEEAARLSLRFLRYHRSMRAYVFVLCAATLAAQQPPPNIVTDNVPEIPRELVRKLNPYQNIRAAQFASWHPTRREMLISTRFADTPQIHLVKAPGADRRQLTFFREPVSYARFSPKADWFLFAMDEGGSEFTQFYRFDTVAGSYEMITDGKSVNRPGPFGNRGDRFAFASTRRNARDFDLYVMDPERPGTTRLLYQAEGSWSPLDWSPDDTRLLALRYVSVNESYLHVIDVASGRIAPLLPEQKEPAAYSAALWSKDGKGIFLVSDLGSEFQRLLYLDLATRQLTPLTAQIPWDVDDIALSEDGSVLAFATNEDGIGRLHLLETATRREIAAPKLADGQISLGRFHKKLPELAFSCITPRSTLDVYSYNWRTKELTRWTSSEAGGLNPETFPATALVHFPSIDGRTIPAFVAKPGARFQAPYPVLISIHGGPEGQARPGLNASYALNELGIAVIQPNVRGSTGYGKTYVKLDNGTLREDSVKDIGALLDWIRTQPDLDASRVGVMGGSYGGYMSLASMVHYSDRLKCGIDIVGISNWVTFLKTTQSYRQDLRRAEYGDERDPRMRDFLESISPLNHAGSIQVPMLVVQGTNDPRVPVTESQQMVKKVRESGHPVWYIEAKDEGHGFRKKQNRDYETWVETVFLERFLLK
jgi:dipeptidyl aminopeptidase/acylaminoacyl peptidase